MQFQCAIVLTDTLSSRMNEVHLIDVLKPKVLGTWNLHLVSRKYPLDYFVMHSSKASVMGNIGQSNYGAVNAFMDCLAHYGKLNGLSGQSINWGPLDVGMVKDGANIEEILKQHGYFSLDVSDIKENELWIPEQRTILITDMSAIEVKGSLAIKDLHKVIGKFMKQTTSGCDHKVTISIKNEENERTLNWGFLEKTMTKSLSMSAIEKLKRLKQMV
ncbi:unnamed protein product [Mytilus edulis]|uniref:Ketoreductase domain-containing protein n=1 Tax=Mytilus edulis TaxID=6550 RepID=A0A8S3R109_MYTED|nr:unnamed protein product [Mytilus edulis]